MYILSSAFKSFIISNGLNQVRIHDFFVYGSGKNSRIRPDPAKSLGSVFATQVYLHRVKVEIIIQPWYIYLHIHQLYTTADNYTVYTPPATMAHDIHSPPQPPISPISAFVFFSNCAHKSWAIIYQHLRAKTGLGSSSHKVKNVQT